MIAQTTTPTSTPPPNPWQAPAPTKVDAAYRTAVLASVNILFIVLAVRLILLVAVVGAIWMTVTVERDPDPYRLAALAIYAVIVVLPTVWLTSRQSR